MMSSCHTNIHGDYSPVLKGGTAWAAMAAAKLICHNS